MTRPAARTTAGDSLARRLHRAFTLMVVLVVVVGGSGLAALMTVTSKLETLSRALSPSVEANAHALQLMVDAETGVRGYLLTRDPTFLSPYSRAREQVLSEIDRSKSLAHKAGVEVDFTAEREAARLWFEGYATKVVVVGDGAGAPSSVSGKQAFDRFRNEQAAVAEVLVGERQHVRDTSRAVRTSATPIMIAMTLLFVVTAALIARRGVRSVDQPLQQLRDVLERLRMGEASARAGTDGPREVREVAMATNALADEGERLRARQSEATRMWRAAREASRRVREELGHDAVLTAAARELGLALEVDRVWIRYVTGGESDASSRYPLQAQWQREGLTPRDRLPHPDAESLAAIRRLHRTGEVYAASNVSADERLQGTQGHLLSQLTGARSVLAVPVGGNDDVIAVAVLVQEKPREFTAEAVRTAQWVCGDLGRALEHSRLFEQQLELVDRLQELDRQKTDFLSTISHELRTPLTSIAGYAELLRDGDAGPVTRQMEGMLEVIERNTVRLRTLIEDLLMLSRIESGALRSTVAEVDIAALVESVARSLRPQADAGGLQVEVATGDDRLVVLGDEMQLERGVLNLLTNAVKFTPAGGRVSVGMGVVPSFERDAVELCVRDTGIGIPAAEQEQLFTRFFRASNAVERAVPGTGLGLSIVRGILEHHGGTLELTSAPGEGTQARVRLPLVRESQPAG